MSEVGDAVELTYTTAPGSVVTMSWINRDTGEIVHDTLPVQERLDVESTPTGQFPVTLLGTAPGFWEARFTSSGAAVGVESYFERFEVVGGPAPLATLSEYEELYGRLSAARQATARALLRRASKLVRDSYPGLQDRIEAGTVQRDTIGLAVINMVAKVLRNPAGLRSETTGPFARAYDPDAASGLLELTGSERQLLEDAGLGAGGRRRGAIGSARIRGGLVPPPSSRPGRRWPRGGY